MLNSKIDLNGNPCLQSVSQCSKNIAEEMSYKSNCGNYRKLSSGSINALMNKTSIAPHIGKKNLPCDKKENASKTSDLLTWRKSLCELDDQECVSPSMLKNECLPVTRVIFGALKIQERDSQFDNDCVPTIPAIQWDLNNLDEGKFLFLDPGISLSMRGPACTASHSAVLTIEAKHKEFDQNDVDCLALKIAAILQSPYPPNFSSLIAARLNCFWSPEKNICSVQMLCAFPDVKLIFTKVQTVSFFHNNQICEGILTMDSYRHAVVMAYSFSGPAIGIVVNEANVYSERVFRHCLWYHLAKSIKDRASSTLGQADFLLILQSSKSAYLSYSVQIYLDPEIWISFHPFFLNVPLSPVSKLHLPALHNLFSRLPSLNELNIFRKAVAALPIKVKNGTEQSLNAHVFLHHTIRKPPFEFLTLPFLSVHASQNEIIQVASPEKENVAASKPKKSVTFSSAIACNEPAAEMMIINHLHPPQIENKTQISNNAVFKELSVDAIKLLRHFHALEGYSPDEELEEDSVELMKVPYRRSTCLVNRIEFEDELE